MIQRRPGEEALIQFFQGLSLPEEDHAIRLYLALKVDEEYIEQCMQKAMGDLDAAYDPAISMSEMDRVWHQMQPIAPPQIVTKKRVFGWLHYAAAVAIVAVCGIAFLLWKNALPDSTNLAWQRWNAEAGAAKVIKLADESVVTLFPGSSLEIPENFNKSERQLRLTGRAFFEVKHDTQKPLYVSTGDLLTTDLGTAFEINAAEGNKIITLHSGKVAVSYAGVALSQLTPNQQLSFNETSKHYRITETDASIVPAWLQGKLSYNQATMADIIRDLEKWYNVQITATNQAILNRRVTVAFKDLPIAEVLQLLSRSADFHYTINHSQITLK